jgi:hypothetical protein
MSKKKENFDFITRLPKATGVKVRSKSKLIMKSLTLKEVDLIKQFHFFLVNLKMTSNYKKEYLFKRAKLSHYGEMSRRKGW